MAKCPRNPYVKPKIGQNNENCPGYKKHMENQKIQQYNVKRKSDDFRFDLSQV